jgi:hypothetical protein
MKSPLFTAAAVACAFASVASAQSAPQAANQKAALSVPAATKAAQGSISVQPSTPGSSLLVGPNDLCANATAISGSGPFAFDNTGAGTDGPSNCGALGADVWFTWTAGATGGFVLSICGLATYDTAISVYNGGSCTLGTLLVCNDDFCGLQSQGSFNAVNGQQYKIQIGGFASSQGTGSFTINALPPPAGNDACNAPVAIAGAGPFAFDNSSATTGAEGQNEGICLAFGTPGIDHDLWYTWTAGSTGQATLSLCGLAGHDSKVAVYPGAPACPVNGTAIVCNDDSCGLQSQVCFNVTNGTAYTIQMGTYPSALGGAGSFSINVAGGGGGGCTLDDGSSENMLGWTAGGDMGWIQRFGTTGPTSLSSVQVAWGSAAFPGLSPGNGSPTKVLVYEDPNDDGNPNDLVLVQQINTVVSNVDTDTLNNYPVTPVVLNGVFFLGAGEVHPSGNYVAVMDQSSPPCGDFAWFFGDNTGAAANYNNPSANIFPPATFSGIGFPTLLLVRGGCNASPFTPICLPGQGGIIPCPCGNPPAGGGLGCNNFGAGPAASGTLAGSGNNSLSGDTIVLAASGENNTSLTVFWQGRDPVHPTGVPHAAGVRCVTQTLKRLYTGNASGGAISRPGMGDASVSARSAAVGDPILAGQNRHYFTIYRDPSAAGPCGNTASTVNLTNAGTITWAP